MIDKFVEWLAKMPEKDFRLRVVLVLIWLVVGMTLLVITRK
jgi:hypothetical protein